MKRVLSIAALSGLLFFINPLKAQIGDPAIGRWNLTVTMGERQMPSWLEVRNSGHGTLLGRFVFAFGSARPVAHVVRDGDRYTFEIPRQWEPGPGTMSFTFALTDTGLAGTMNFTDGVDYPFTGVLAPELRHDADIEWGEPVALFNGHDLSGWRTDREEIQWKVRDGVLVNPRSGANLISLQTFGDFKLKAVFRYPGGSNSGIFLRGRYEVQIEDNYGLPPSDILFGAIYGFLEPNEMAVLKAGEWQTYEVTLIGRRVTVVANGKTVIADRTIPGMTGGALDNDEASPGPIMIQGDHGPIEFRELTITPAQR